MKTPVIKKIRKICPVCNEQFIVHPYRENTAIYCSLKCLGKATYQSKGFTMKGKPQSAEFSENTRKRMMGNLFRKGLIPWNKGIKWIDASGKNHWNWKGGITAENTKLRNSLEYKAWVLSVFKRDWFTCKMPDCGYKGRDIESHHIKRVQDYPELLLDINNGITLCRDCHNSIRKREEMFGKLFQEIIDVQITAQLP